MTAGSDHIRRSVLILAIAQGLYSSATVMFFATAGLGAGGAAILGIGFAHFGVALALLGLGWNFAFIGGTTMLTGCYRPAEQGKVQALNDFSIPATMVVASFSSGRLLSAYGWQAVAVAMLPMAALALLLIRCQLRSRPARQAV